MAKHTTSLEFEVYGKRNIQEFQRILEKAGVSLELVETKAESAKNKVKGMADNVRVATATLHGLSAAQTKFLTKSLETANLSGKMYQPWVKTTQILKTEEQIQKEKESQEEFKKAQRIAAESAKERIAAERIRAREEIANQRSAQKAERVRVAQKRADDAAAHRKKMAELRAEERKQRDIERDRQRTIRELKRATGFDEQGLQLSGKSVSGPMRVVVYDLVRRTLTEIYGLVNKIGNSFSNWIIDGIKFNDELKRSQTFFTSLGILGLKAPGGSQMTVAEAAANKDPKVRDMYQKSVASSEVVMRRLMSVSAMTGQDLGEIVSSTRQAMTDLLNKINKEGKAGAYLENVDMLADVSERMVKLGSVLRMADPQNRKLSFHMVALQELFSGTANEAKKKGKEESAGMQNMRSMLMREGIKIGEERMRKITQYVNAGNLKAAMDEVQSSLERSGLGFEQLANMIDSTLQPAVDGAQMYLRIFNKIFTSDLYENVLKPFFQALLKHMYFLEKNKTFVQGIERLGSLFSSYVDAILKDFASIIDYFTMIPDYTKDGNQNLVYKNLQDTGFFKFTEGMANIISTLGGGAQVMYAIFKVVGQFFWGLLGLQGGQSLSELAKQIEAFGETARKTGEWIRWALEWIIGVINNNSIFGIKVTTILAVVTGLRAFLFVLKAIARVTGAISLTKGAIGLASKTGIAEAVKKKFLEAFAAITFSTSKMRNPNAAAATTSRGIMPRIGEVLGSAWMFFSDGIKKTGLFIFNSFKNVFGSLAAFILPNLKNGTWPLFEKIGRFIQVFATQWVPKLIGNIGTIFDTLKPIIMRNLPKIGLELLKVIPYVRIASIIAAVLIAVGPIIFDKLKEVLPPMLDSMMKSQVKSILPFTLPEGNSWQFLNPLDIGDGKPPVTAPKPVAPKQPPSITNNSPSVRIDTVNIHGDVKNMDQFVSQVKNRGRSINESPMDPSFGPRYGGK